ncbi:MAG: SNF2 family DNA or RNA helicase [Paraglaciecola sp.]|jgi:SNF2 family DNA or RNA helicase
MFSLTEIKSAFEYRDWSKGWRMAESGYVNKDTIECYEDGFSGTVRSERTGQTYHVEVEADKHGIDASCSCYVGYFCKHAAALSIVMCDANTHIPLTPNHMIESWLSGIQPASSKKASNTVKLVYILDSSVVASSPGISILVARSRVLKSGELSKSLKNIYLSEYFLKDKTLSEYERHICADIIGTKDALGQVQDFSLVRRIIETGRGFWQKIANGPLQLGESCEGQFNWQEKGKDGFELLPTLTRKGCEVLSTQPSAYINNQEQQIGLIDFGLDQEKARQVLNMPAVSKQQLAWIMPQLKSFLAEDFTNIGSPATELGEELVAPIAKLHFFSPMYGPDGSMAILVFAYDNIDVNPHSASNIIQAKGKTLSRNLLFERQAIELLHNADFKTVADNYSNGAYIADYRSDYGLKLNKNNWPVVLHQLLPKLEQQGWQVSFADNFYYSTQEAGTFNAEIDEQGNDFFSLAINVDIDGKPQSLLPILQSAISQLPKSELLETSSDTEKFIYIDMGRGQSLPLQLHKIKPLISQFVELFMPSAVNKEGKLTLSRFQSHNTLDALDSQGITSSGEQQLRQIANKLKSFERIKHVTCPDTVNAQLRDYQQSGLNWLQFLREYQLAGILGDDMGLGKTLQALANLSVEQQQGRLITPALIIAPTSVVFNWQNEIEKFTPGLTHKVMHGDKRQMHFADMHKYQVVITSYALIARDIEHYQQQPFHYLILDEAQYIKNPKTKLYGAILSLKANHKLCITGTPMENHLGELWSQFNFLLPSFLAGQAQFTKLFRTPIEKQRSNERLALLNKRIQPFILRRTKDIVAKELPAKTEIIRTVRLEGKQAELYESVRLVMDKKLRDIIKSKGLLRSQIEVLDAMLKLRQVCCHPQLLSLESAQKVTQSAKLEHLMDMLPELVEEGRRILLFSQFTSMLALIEVELVKHNIAYVKLTGSTKDRQKVLAQFKQGTIPVFLISLKAGGTGLNLTEADTVIHYDPWWNPAVEDQATDRVHRIGQDKPVFVYKLVVEGSIEQKILELQKHKSQLADSILSDKLSDKEVGLTPATLQSLLKPLGQ